MSRGIASGGRAVAGIGLIAFSAVAGACAPDDEPPTASDVLREEVDYTIFGMTAVVTREGLRRARLEADTAEFIGETEVHMRGMTLTFYQDGRETTEVIADSGIYYELSQDMEARGSVNALDRADGQRLETEMLRYANAEDRLYGDTAFTLYRDGGRTVIKGEAFESDPSLDSLVILSSSGQTERRLAPVPAGRGEAPGGAGRDSAGVVETLPPDTVTAQPDSAGTPPFPPDSAGAIRSDSSGLGADTLERATGPPDTLALPALPPDTLAPPSGRRSGGAAPSGRSRR